MAAATWSSSSVVWLNMQDPSPKNSGMPSTWDAKLSVNTKLSAESCVGPVKYGSVVRARLKNPEKTAVATLTCKVLFVVQDVNEQPHVVPTSLLGHSIAEDRQPGFNIGAPLKATDPEVDAECSSSHGK